MKLAYKNLGFTLAETIVAIGLLALLVLLVLSVFMLAQKAYWQNDNRAELIQNGRVILDRLERELRQASDIVTEIPPDDSNSLLIPHEIIFQDGHDSTTIHYLRYYLNGQNLKRQIIAYYFSESPNTYVKHDSVDIYSNPPQKLILEDNIVGEYLDNISFYGNDIIYIFLQLSNKNKQINLLTGFYARNL
ncbi:MAG: hypothetical protein WCW02_02075 [Candidatus Buchananbacteria bacterium]